MSTTTVLFVCTPCYGGVCLAAYAESLLRLQRLCAALGHPEQRLSPIIHVAGTNGKGSTVAFIRALAEAARHAQGARA